MKALEAKPGEKLEVSAKQVMAAAASFQHALEEIATGCGRAGAHVVGSD